MIDVVTAIDFLPEHWRESAFSLIALLIAIRTALFSLVKACHALDMRDGKEDWWWVGALGDRLRRFDRMFLSWLPVKAPFVRDR